MNVKYKIGDRVRLKKSSEFYPRQSDGTDGTIESWNYDRYEKTYPNGHDGHDINNGDDQFYFYIKWDNENSNSYRIRDIEPVVSTTTCIPIPEVDSYVKVIDPRWEGVMYVQVTCEFLMNGDEQLCGYGNVITFDKEVKHNVYVSIYHEKEKRRFQPMSNREIVWMNYCLKVDYYLSYDLWKPSHDDLLRIEVLYKYPNLKKGEKFGFVDGQEVKSIHPREWTVESTYIYLAPSGDGGAKVFESGKWADRSKYMAGVDPHRDDSDAEEPPFKVDDIIEAIDGCAGVLYKVGDIFTVKSCNSIDVVISRQGHDMSVPCKFFRKINLVGMKVEVLKDHLQSARVKKREILKIKSAYSKGISAESNTTGNWGFSIFQLNEKDGLRLIRDYRLSTATPYLKTSTTKKRESFIEHVEPIKIKTSKRVPNKLKIN